MSDTSKLIRMIPLQPSQLPLHPTLTSTDSELNERPDLLTFTLALLNDANSILHPISFNMHFKSHSHKLASPSNTQVEALTYTIPSETISKIKWDDPAQADGVGRGKPREVPTEHWVARRSYHANVSTKQNPATANWPEFVFGLRDNHSRNECEFTPTLYDARHILDWNSELDTAWREWKLNQQEHAESPNRIAYTNVTLAVYEMCHEIPFPLQPRTFSVLVATASTSPTGFIAVTVPVNLSSFEGAFYANGRNRTEGEDAQRRKQTVVGLYAAVEKCEIIKRDNKAVDTSGANEGDKAQTQPNSATEEIEWIMATASDAKGNLPMIVQKSSMPSAVVKDVGYFLKWIHGVDEAVIRGEMSLEQDKARKGSGSSGVEKKGSRTGSSASLQMLSSARSSIEKAASLVPP